MEADTENGFFMNVNSQVEEVCAKLKNDSKLQVIDWTGLVGFLSSMHSEMFLLSLDLQFLQLPLLQN